jgi:hypothetical protein
MQYTSFSDVERLDSEGLKALLVEGEPPERVWAAWALGLRHHEGFARDLRGTVAEEPHAGVRRHLVVVLAGAGESRSVRTLAVHDPDERVRATALQYVARLAGAKDHDANHLLADVLARGAPLLKLGCIAGLRADAPPVLWGAAAACVTSADRDLRWAAYEAVMRHGAFAHPGPELARELLNREPEPPTRRTGLHLLHERAGPNGLRQLLEDRALNAGVLPEVVEALHDHAVQLEWLEVDDLIARLPDPGPALRLLVVGSEGLARPALLRLFVTDRLVPQFLRAMRDELMTRLRRAFDQNGAPLVEAERQLHQALAEHVEQAANAARNDPHYFDDIEGVDPALLPASDPDKPIDPLSLPSFCEEEREILARLAALELH